MNVQAATVFLTFPPRSLGDGEREAVRQWLAAAPGIAAAFASERRGDDPAYYRRIVVIETGQRTPSWLVHCPDGTDVWLLTILGERPEVRLYPTLRAALQGIRPVPGTPVEEPQRPVPDWMGGAAAKPRKLSAAPARTVAEMAAALRRPRDVDSAVGAPRRRLP